MDDLTLATSIDQCPKDGKKAKRLDIGHLLFIEDE